MKPWHEASTHEVIAALQSNAQSGLSADEVRTRVESYGPNALTEHEAVTWYSVLIRQFTNFLIFILAVAAVLSYILGDIFDASAILAILLLNGFLGFAQEWKAEKALKNLKKMLTPHCKVLREGHIQQVAAHLIVPGDVVLLESGDSVPADLRLYEAVNLKTNEAALTGESAPVDKDTQPVAANAHITDRTSMVWMGTHVVNGRGRGLVVATGATTEFGRIASLTGKIQQTETRLQLQLRGLGRQLGLWAMGIAGLIMLIGWLDGKPLLQMFMAAVTLSVAAVPEGLPAVVTITLALGVRLMARHKALMRSLQATETLGATSVICTDKTGTLTKNEMTIQELWLASGRVHISGTGYEPKGTFSRDGQPLNPHDDADLMALLETGRKCNHAQLLQKEGQWVVMGSSTEGAFMVAAAKAGLTSTDYSAICHEFSFDSTRKRMSVVEKTNTEEVRVHVKGAPEVLLTLATHVLKNGVPHPLDDTLRAEIQQAYTSLAQNGLRTLALAYKTAPHTAQLEAHTAESDLVFLGVAGMIDPPRPEVAAAMAKAHKAGIRVMMITGDSPDTALAVAKQIGLKVQTTLTGDALKGLSDKEASALLKGDVLFARTVPEDKFRIVQLLQAQNELVAMTGDGVNDAPALKQADIGIAMGIRGTDVARGAADMVLSDDNFATIISAIEEGRRQYANIKKFVQYLVSSNAGETLAIFLNILMGGPLILLPIQILWVNLVTDSVTALSLSFEKAEGDVMHQPPRASGQPILDKPTLLPLGLFGLYIGVTTVLVYEVYAIQNALLANTVAFTALVAMVSLHTLNFRSLRAPMAAVGWLTNPYLLVALVSMLLLHVAAVYLPFMQEVLKTQPLGWQDWGVVVLVALPLFAVTDMWKRFCTKSNNAAG